MCEWYFRDKITQLAIVLLSGAAIGFGHQAHANADDVMPPKVVEFGPVMLEGISALQLSWWFDHIADEHGAYFTPLSAQNKSIRWETTPAQAGGHTGAVYVAEHDLVGRFNRVRVFYDNWKKPPEHMQFPFPAPRGHNQNAVIVSDDGFVLARMIVSYRDTGSGDVQLGFVFVSNFLGGPNRPATETSDGYAFSDREILSFWSHTRSQFAALSEYLPGWFGNATQDNVARKNGFTVVAVVEPGLMPGVSSEMLYWFFNHMGDEPGDVYRAWAPRDHRATRWLISPRSILGGEEIPVDRIVYGSISSNVQRDRPDRHTGTGAKWYPPAAAPVAGWYKNFLVVSPTAPGDDSPRNVYLIHTWQDGPGGVFYRTSRFLRLPLADPVPQAQYQFEHSWYEASRIPVFLPRMFREAKAKD